MVWAAPMTAVAGEVFTAREYNQYIRDNLRETAPALANTASGDGSYFVITGTNSISLREAEYDRVDAFETLAQTTSYSDLDTPGPSVTVETGAHALVIWGATGGSMVTSGQARVDYEVSGDTSISPSLVGESQWDGLTGTAVQTLSAVEIQAGLTPGTNTFTLKYRAVSDDARWQDRWIAVVPIS